MFATTDLRLVLLCYFLSIIFFNHFLPVEFELDFWFEVFLRFPPLPLSFLLNTRHSEEGAASTLVLSAENSFSGVNAGVCPCRAGACFCQTFILTCGNIKQLHSKIKQPEAPSAVPDQDEMKTIKTKHHRRTSASKTSEKSQVENKAFLFHWWSVGYARPDSSGQAAAWHERTWF